MQKLWSDSIHNTRYSIDISYWLMVKTIELKVIAFKFAFIFLQI